MGGHAGATTGGSLDDVGSALEALRRLPFFQELSNADLVGVARSVRQRDYGPGEVLFVEGEECRGLYLVRQGLVRIFKTSPDAKEQMLRLMGPGDSFNEVPVFDGGPNPASAQAIEPTSVFLVPRQDVLALVRSSPAFAAAVIAVLAARLRHLVALVEDLSFRHVTARIAKILLQRLQPAEGVGAGAARRTRLTQQEMAEMAGTAREVVGRALRTIEDAGAIRIERGHIEVLDADALERLT